MVFILLSTQNACKFSQEYYFSAIKLAQTKKKLLILGARKSGILESKLAFVSKALKICILFDLITPLLEINQRETAFDLHKDSIMQWLLYLYF